MEYWYTLTGPKHWQDLHIANMQSVDMFISGISPNGREFQQPMKMICEPVQLIRLVFPRTALPYVQNTLGRTPDRGIIQSAGLFALRQMIGLKEIPPMPTNGEGSPIKMQVSTDYLNIIPLGIKEDGEDRLMNPTLVKQEPI